MACRNNKPKNKVPRFRLPVEGEAVVQLSFREDADGQGTKVAIGLHNLADNVLAAAFAMSLPNILQALAKANGHAIEGKIEISLTDDEVDVDQLGKERGWWKDEDSADDK